MNNAKEKKVKAKAVKAKAVKPVKKVEKVEMNSVQFWLSFVAVFFLLINGIGGIFMSKMFSQVFQFFHVTIPAATLLTYGIIWFVLGILIWLTVLHIEKAHTKAEKWFLLILGIITLIAARVLEGLLVLAASIIYLVKK